MIVIAHNYKIVLLFFSSSLWRIYAGLFVGRAGKVRICVSLSSELGDILSESGSMRHDPVLEMLCAFLIITLIT
jgi:hypothetical protein